MKKTKGTLYIKILVQCPHCENMEDLLDDAELDIEKSDLMHEVFINGDKWGTDNAETVVLCSECGEQYEVDLIEY